MSQLKPFSPPADYQKRWSPGGDPASMPGGFNENAFDVTKQDFSTFDITQPRFSGDDAGPAVQPAKAGVTMTPWLIGLLAVGLLWTLGRRKE